MKEAGIAAEACDLYQDGFSESLPWKQDVRWHMLRKGEERDFIKAYYRATALATLGEESLSSRMLSFWNRLELKQVREVIDWVMGAHGCNVTLGIGVTFKYYSSPMPVGETRGEVWEEISGCLKELNRDLDGFTSKPDRAPGRGPLLFSYTVRHRYQEQCRSYRDTRLADLLPLVRQKGPRYNIGYRLSDE